MYALFEVLPTLVVTRIFSRYEGMNQQRNDFILNEQKVELFNQFEFSAGPKTMIQPLNATQLQSICALETQLFTQTGLQLTSKSVNMNLQKLTPLMLSTVTRTVSKDTSGEHTLVLN